MTNKETYKELLKDSRWIKKRNEILTRDNNTCQFCGRQDRYLHVHHKRYIKGNKPWEYENSDLITLCDRCHEEETEMNASVYDQYKLLRDTFKGKGLSMTLLDTVLSNILDCITRAEQDGEDAKDSCAYEYLRDCICGTQNISDILAAKKCGIELRDLMLNCYTNLVEKYDKI